MNDDTRRILDLLAQGKITVDEAQQLLGAINEPASVGQAAPAAGPDQGEHAEPRWVRIAIHKMGRDGMRNKDFTIRVPIAMVRTGMRIGSLIPGLAGEQVQARMREKGLDVDFTKLDATAIDSVLKSLGETDIEIDDGRSQVRITAE
jgi:hypothetical protein